MNDFVEAMEIAIDVAWKTKKKIFVYKSVNDNTFYLSQMIAKKWLFTSFPGGRKILSKRGWEEFEEWRKKNGNNS